MSPLRPDEFDQTLASLDTQDVLSNRYRLVRELGRGGMGVVWLAEDTTLEGRPVAIKLLPTVLSRNKRAISRLKREANTSLDLTHPHIVRLINFEEDPSLGNLAYLVMQYIDGQTLDDLLAEHYEGLPLKRVVKWAEQIAQALDYAHQRDVLHRDVKPSNIIIDTDDVAYLMDFGIAREIKDTLTHVTGRDTAGTLPYMSPQHIDGRDEKSNDIYSFAATLYEALSGNPPFTTGNLYQQIKTVPPSPLEGMPEFVNRKILQALAKDPDDRPSTASDIALGLFCEDPESFASDSMEMARSSQAEGHLHEALALVNRVLAAGIRSADIEALHREIKQALSDLQQAVLRGREYIKSGDLSSAGRVCDDLLRQYPQNARVHSLRDDLRTAQAEQAFRELDDALCRTLAGARFAEAVSLVNQFATRHGESDRVSDLRTRISTADQEYHRQIDAVDAAVNQRDFETALRILEALQADFTDVPELTERVKKTRTLAESYVTVLHQSRQFIDAGDFRRVEVLLDTLPAETRQWDEIIEIARDASLLHTTWDRGRHEVATARRAGDFILARLELNKVKSTFPYGDELDAIATELEQAAQQSFRIHDAAQQAIRHDMPGKLEALIADLSAIAPGHPSLDEWRLEQERMRDAITQYTAQMASALSSGKLEECLQIGKSLEQRFGDSGDVLETIRSFKRQCGTARQLLAGADQEEEQGRYEEAIDSLEKYHEVCPQAGIQQRIAVLQERLRIRARRRRNRVIMFLTSACVIIVCAGLWGWNQSQLAMARSALQARNIEKAVRVFNRTWSFAAAGYSSLHLEILKAQAESEITRGTESLEAQDFPGAIAAFLRASQFSSLFQEDALAQCTQATDRWVDHIATDWESIQSDRVVTYRDEINAMLDEGMSEPVVIEGLVRVAVTVNQRALESGDVATADRWLGVIMRLNRVETPPDELVKSHADATADKITQLIDNRQYNSARAVLLQLPLLSAARQGFIDELKTHIADIESLDAEAYGMQEAAHNAMNFATEVDAATFAPQHWNYAEATYNRAGQFLERREYATATKWYSDAREAFALARASAENDKIESELRRIAQALGRYDIPAARASLEVVALIRPADARIPDLRTKIDNLEEFDIPLGAGRSLTVHLVPVGTCMIGSRPGDPHHEENEYAYKVQIDKPFYLATTEITEQQWAAVMEPGAAARDSEPEANLPKTNITWSEADEFCKRLAALSKRRVRLPSEEEWEYACRCGADALQLSDVNSMAWHARNANGERRPVATRDANAWGLYDMLGNVSEWTDSSYKVLDDRSGQVVLIGNGQLRTVRGGSAAESADACNPARRSALLKGGSDAMIGFRILVEMSQGG